MQRNVYLQGELAEKFGSKFIVNTNNYADIFKCINSNRPTFMPYLRECVEKDVGFIVETAGKSVGEQECLLPIEEGDITIAIAPAGSKSGIAKILAALVIIFIVLPMMGAAAGAITDSIGAAIFAGATASKAGMALALLSANLAIAGIQQIMAPDPSVDKESPTNYLFSGGANNAKEGDPIPLLYGELRVPGRPISIEVHTGRTSDGEYGVYNVTVDAAGNQNTTVATIAEA
jgi:predicted phage tail protein|tara:strand:+ start:3872 stop:4567 length:696 start_codon:yes stop_codon:yes gene_type:complete